MTSAEQFVNDNLERGYSLEDVRLLAMDCEQPLADEIRAVVAAKECARRRAERLAVSEQSDASEVACETAMYHAVSAGEEAVFLIGPGEEPEAATDGIDFDILQGGSASVESPVLEEESIADIVIGETDGSDIIHAADAGARAMAEDEEAGIWSRLWTRVAGGPVPSVAPSVAPSVRLSDVVSHDNTIDDKTSSHEDAFAAVDPMMDAEEPVMFAVDESDDAVASDKPDFSLAEAAAAESVVPSGAEAAANPVNEPAAHAVRDMTAEPDREMAGSNDEPEQGEQVIDVPETATDAPTADATDAPQAAATDAVSEAVSVMAEADAPASHTESVVYQTEYSDNSFDPVASAEPEAASEPAEPVAETAAEPDAVGSDVEVGSEMSSDYLPGSVVALYDDSEADAVYEEESAPEAIRDEAAKEVRETRQDEEQDVAADTASEAVPEECVDSSRDAVADSFVSEDREPLSDATDHLVTEAGAGAEPELELESEEKSAAEPLIAQVTEPDAHTESATEEERLGEIFSDVISEPEHEVNTNPQGSAEAETDAAPEATTPAEEAVAETTEDHPAPLTAEPAAAEANEDCKVSRRERRRLDRAEKRRKRKLAKADKAALPEIVLTRSEGTETLTPVAESDSEAGDFTAAVDESDSFDNAAKSATTAEHAYSQDAAVPAAEAAVTDAAGENGEADVAGSGPDRPRMSRPMSLVTPNDVFEDADSASFVTLFAAAMADMEGPQLSIVRPDDAADAADRDDGVVAGVENGHDDGADTDIADTYSGDDHYMIIANGGVHQDEIAALHLVGPDAVSGTDEAEYEAETDSAVAAVQSCDAPEDVSENTEETADPAVAAEAAGEFDGGANVILFRENFPFFARDDEEDDGDDNAIALLDGGPVLHLLPPVADVDSDDSALDDVAADGETGMAAIAMAEQPLLQNTMSAAAEPAAPAALAFSAPTGDYLTDGSREGLLVALYGSGTDDEMVDLSDAIDYPQPGNDAEREHAIVSLEPFPDYPLLYAREQELRRDLEEEYQIRLDAFAARLLDVQTAGARTEENLQNAKAELDARAAVLDAMKARLAKEEEAKADLARRLECTTAEMNSRERELDRVRGLRDEHQRLFNEFEDLRKAYNEVVTDVMPTLQNERDDLALTVERQCAEERQVRSQLGATRRRLTVGYGLGVAASLVLVALPVMNWLKSSERARETAANEQLLSELRDNLQSEVEQNIRAQNEIVELQNKIGLARAQIVDLQSKNQELAQVRTRVMQPDSDIAVFRPESATGGTPTRASTMALQATPPAGGRLHVNEVRDPAGSIEQVVAMNRARNQGEDQVAVRPAGAGQSGGRMQVSAVARTDARSLRPGGDAARVNAAAANDGRQRSGQAKAQTTARPGEVLATVKKGEGVAQVVYRVLGTWNPEVVAWVIRENKIKSDRRGNPIIQPNQQLRLPNEGNIGQAASAKRR
ncbi:MAG: hypothetical protein LUG50_08625 [Planctomycetaceae bacterium]|nr:hypothetical protein [Planctomycetaceae bacterium]